MSGLAQHSEIDRREDPSRTGASEIKFLCRQSSFYFFVTSYINGTMSRGLMLVIRAVKEGGGK